MKEYKVGEQIVLEVAKEHDGCKGCFFLSELGCCIDTVYMPCMKTHRSDEKGVIFVEKGK